MGLLDLFGFGKRKEQMKEAIKNGAIIIDVRTPGEYMGGHIDGSRNIPLGSVGAKLESLKSTGKPVVFCCASGMRSGSAASQAKSAGIEAYNGGGWMSLNGLMQNI